MAQSSFREDVIYGDWGKDELTRRIDDARENILSTYFYHRPFFDLLSRINDLFLQFVGIMSQFSDENKIEASPAAFLGRTYGCYLGSVRLATSGQFGEAFVLFRACIETALYGFYMSRNPGLADVWLQRHESKESRDSVKMEFRIGAMFELLVDDNARIGQFVRETYEKTIDYGAHPNVYSIACNIKFLKDEKRWVLDIFNVEEFLLKYCFLNNAKIGWCALSIFSLVYLDEFKKTKIPQELNTLFRDMNKLSSEVSDEL